jgi:uncharacterized protein YcbX
MYTLSEINIYPIKSLGGISLQSSEVEERGLKYDRRWMLVINENKFITQREYPQMALLQVNLDENGLLINHKKKDFGKLYIPFNYDFAETKDVIIWEDICKGSFYDKQIDNWFSEALETKCRLVYMPDTSERLVNPKRVKNKIVSFADGYPFLIIGQSSLDDLNSRMENPLPMNRFRPNLVFAGGSPYEEDEWNKFKIGEVKFRAIKPSVRCMITTIDQETAEFAHEPLKTLAKYRRAEGGVIFGMNLVCESAGIVKVDDEIHKKLF